ncbi:MAG: hypothetical protein JO235_10955 [Chroococcidiopsidaceae cyanobacterium CP_BM_RX_35]|nr:hypothetical protein [Chroococcidiopsidaceae cyanobacterium CP_BM_RX_35]
MVKFGYHASHEQFKPSQLLTYIWAAEQAGFTTALSSDHFQRGDFTRRQSAATRIY